MIFFYTARAPYSATNTGDKADWKSYLEWSHLDHLTELVSLDQALNEDLVTHDYDAEHYWAHSIVDDEMITSFFSTPDYVLANIKPQEKFNMLAVIVEPEDDCKDVVLDGYEFMGYELLDKDYTTSALSNCGGFWETYTPSDINEFGLIDDIDKALDIRERLLENSPDEYHADTNIVAVWRHKTIGR